MASERLKRQIDRLLDEAQEAITQRKWDLVRERAESVLAIDPGNSDGLAFLAVAERGLAVANGLPSVRPAQPQVAPAPATPAAHHTSFANGRYEVKKFLGEGGKKKVFLAYDTLLDRDVAFALIKTEGLDEAARQRITREARAMGRLGDHPHIMPIYDLGQHEGQPFMVLPLMGGGDLDGLIKRPPTAAFPWSGPWR